jgi:hypothetical protein
MYFDLAGFDAALDVIVLMEGSASKGISLECLHDWGAESAGYLSPGKGDVNLS